MPVVSRRGGVAAALAALLLAAAPARADGERVLCERTAMCTLTFLAPLSAAPFPYDGVDAASGRPFFDTVDPLTGQPAHTTADGGVYPRDPHYTDASVLVHVPPSFRPAGNPALVVFFHHHMTRLPRAVEGETQVIEQVNRSGRNVVLIAPQLAVEAYDSAAGNLFRPGGLAALLDEAVGLIASRLGGAESLARAPVILVAYSGGYRSLAFALDRGGIGERLAGALLIDGIYDQDELFVRHLTAPGRQSWFQVVYSEHSAAHTEAVRDRLQAAGLALTPGWPERLQPGTTGFHRVETPHRALPIVGPPFHPIGAALAAWQAP